MDRYEWIDRGGKRRFAVPHTGMPYPDAIAARDLEILRLAERVRELEAERAEGIQRTSAAVILRGNEELTARIAALEEENRRLRMYVAEARILLDKAGDHWRRYDAAKAGVLAGFLAKTADHQYAIQETLEGETPSVSLPQE